MKIGKADYDNYDNSFPENPITTSGFPAARARRGRLSIAEVCIAPRIDGKGKSTLTGSPNSRRWGTPLACVFQYHDLYGAVAA